jgi:hypothetical protein
VKHFHYQTFAVPPDPIDVLEKLKISFVTDLNGDISSVSIPLEENVALGAIVLVSSNAGDMQCEGGVAPGFSRSRRQPRRFQHSRAEWPESVARSDTRSIGEPKFNRKPGQTADFYFSAASYTPDQSLRRGFTARFWQRSCNTSPALSMGLSFSAASKRGIAPSKSWAKYFFNAISY